MRSFFVIAAVGTTLAGFSAKAPASTEPVLTTSSAVAPVLVDFVSAADTARDDDNSALVACALEELSGHGTHNSDKDPLRMAFQAYYNYKAANAGEVRKPYLHFVDYGLVNRTARGYVFDMQRLELIEGPFIVAHGRG